MATTKSQLIMDNCLRLTAFNKETGMAKFMLTDVEDFDTNVEVANTRDVVDHNGTTVATLESGKRATISGNASFVNFGLLAAQAGSDVQVGTEDAPIITPRYETFSGSDASAGVITLEKEPVGESGAEVKFLYVLNDDGTLSNVSYPQSATADDSSFSVTGDQLTLPTGLPATNNYAVFYDFSGAGTTLIENNDGEFGGTYIIKADILCRDICNADLQTIVTIESKNAKLESAYDVTWNSDSRHPFSFIVSKSFCDSGKGNLLSTYVLED